MTAAGAYQILYGTWAEAKQKGVAPDFTPQDKTRRAYQLVAAGNIEQAIPLLRNEWTLLPGAKQSKMTMETAKQKFTEFQKLVGT
jgi:muramidase (phage lysozyme)